MRSAFLVLAAFLTLGLTGCLQDEKDPAAPADVGKLTGSFYASGLGNVAVQIQNYVMGRSEWFSETSSSGEIDLASIGISQNALGATLKSYVCPLGDGASVYQITWLDGRNEQGKFSVKGIGTDAGSIVQSLRARVAPYQVGIYSSGASIDMASGQPLTIPGSCGGLPIPAGSPVIAFRIDRPAPPTQELTRTEYKTDSCGVDEQGLARRGTKVLKRTITFMKDGTINVPAWETENMGNCVDDVLVTIEDREKATGGGNSDLANFAAIALRDLLQAQLAMDCMSVNVKSNKRNTKSIDTCGRVGVTGNQAVGETNAADATDQRTLACKGSTLLNMVRFTNLRGDRLGLSTTSWTSGSATILRTLDNKTVNNGQGQEANRYKWLGTNINCGGGETFFVTCDKIPGNPALEDRHSWSKWLSMPINGWFVSESWFAGAFNLCWFGSCKRVVGGSATYLNPEYFTGTSIYAYSGTTTNRGMQATSWLDNETFRPNPTPSTAWRLPDSTNWCIWQQRVMVAACPFTYDPSRNGGWDPGYRYYNSVPVALDPGIGNPGGDAGNLYAQSRAQGFLTANVTLLWEDCNFKGCDYWNESAGPGTGVYIKQWQTSPVADGSVILSGAAKEIRTNMCSDLAFQLNSSSLVPQAQAQLDQKNAALQQREAELNTATATLATAQSNLDGANGTVSVYQTAVTNADSQVTNRTNLRNTAQSLVATRTQEKADAQTLVDTRTTEQAAAQTAYDNNPSPGNQSALNTANANLASAQSALATAGTNLTSAENALDTAETNLTNAQTALTTAQGQLTAAQATQATAQTTFNGAQTAYNNALSARNTAQAERDVAEQQLAAAQSAASSGLGRDLTPAERTALQAAYDGSCAHQADTLNATEQASTRATCNTNYNSPATYAALPSINNYCNAVFDRAGDGSITFKVVQPGNGTNIITTLLNTEGVMLAHKPTLLNNETLQVTQRDFTEPLNCLRQEENYFSWPRVYTYWVCGGKGGCWPVQAVQYFTITESTTRQWSGLSYSGGTWSNASHGYRSPYGNWNNYWEIPNPLY